MFLSSDLWGQYHNVNVQYFYLNLYSMVKHVDCKLPWWLGKIQQGIICQFTLWNNGFKKLDYHTVSILIFEQFQKQSNAL